MQVGEIEVRTALNTIPSKKGDNIKMLLKLCGACTEFSVQWPISSQEVMQSRRRQPVAEKNVRSLQHGNELFYPQNS